jgi:hypothetical protein
LIASGYNDDVMLQAQEAFHRGAVTLVAAAFVVAVAASGMMLMSNGGSVRVNDPRPQPSIGLTAPATPGATILPELPGD